MGRQGMVEVASQSAKKAHWLASEICKLDGFTMAHPNAPYFREFVVNTPIPAATIIERCQVRGIYPGTDMARFGKPNQLMIAVTEKKDRELLSDLITALKEVSHA